MRLIDLILSAQGGTFDRVFHGAATSLAKSLRTAECFELADDVVAACHQVAKSKPSSLLSALPLTRLPYPRTWVEWHGHPEVLGAAPDRPLRLGCLFESLNETLDYGTITWAWTHSPTDLELLTICPLGVVFDWRVDADLPAAQRHWAKILDDLPSHLRPEFDKWVKQVGFASSSAFTGYMRKMADYNQPSLAQTQEAMRSDWSRWRRVASDQEEIEAARQLHSHGVEAACLHFFRFFTDMAARGMTSTPQWNQMMEKSRADVSGEYAFAQAFACLLNARQGLDYEREDLARLNKRRLDSGKSALCEFTVTRLHLSRVAAARAQASGMTRQQYRQHMVRGHFKVRQTGIYWWSPFVRGHGEAVRRERYTVN